MSSSCSMTVTPQSMSMCSHLDSLPRTASWSWSKVGGKSSTSACFPQHPQLYSLSCLPRQCPEGKILHDASSDCTSTKRDPVHWSMTLNWTESESSKATQRSNNLKLSVAMKGSQVVASGNDQKMAQICTPGIPHTKPKMLKLLDHDTTLIWMLIREKGLPMLPD